MKKLLLILLISVLTFSIVMYANAKRHGVVAVTAGDTVAGGGTEYDTTDISAYLQVKRGDYTSEADGASIFAGDNIAICSYLVSCVNKDTTDCSLYVYALPDSTNYKTLLKSWVIRDDSLSAFNVDTLAAGQKRMFRFAQKLEVITVNNCGAGSTANAIVHIMYAE